MKPTLVIVLTVLLLCSQAVFAMANPLHISGASTIQPILMEAQAQFYQQTGIALDISGGGSGAGVQNVLRGSSQVGSVSRSLSQVEGQSLNQTLIGLDALVIIVDEKNLVTELTKSELIQVFSGEVRNWSHLGGIDLPITVISKEVGRSTLDLLESYSGLVSPQRVDAKGPFIATDVHIIGSNLEGLTLVAGIPGAIGYVSYGSALTLQELGLPIKILVLDGVPPTREAIVDRSYPIIRELNMVYLEETEPITMMMDFLLSEYGQSIVRREGFVSVLP